MECFSSIIFDKEVENREQHNMRKRTANSAQLIQSFSSESSLNIRDLDNTMLTVSSLLTLGFMGL